jgi:ELWxxDGT repeat protein
MAYQIFRNNNSQLRNDNVKRASRLASIMIGGLFIFGSGFASAQPAFLVKDIRHTTLYSASNPQEFVEVGVITFFRAFNPIAGWELWKTDGTEEGTMMVRDICPGTGGSYPQYLTNVNGTLFFSADDRGSARRELWKSDGTQEGTVLVRNIHSYGGWSSNPQWLTNVNGTLYFAAEDYPHTNALYRNRELWKSDGTSAGTVRVADVWPGVYSTFPEFLTNVNGVLFFRNRHPSYYYELWKSDGTSGGTALVKDIGPGGQGSFPTALLQSLENR